MNAIDRPSRRARLQRRRRSVRFEQLETRRLLATLDVNSLMDAVDADPGDGVCEISAGGPCTLRAAIQEANALPGPDRINLPAGTYTLSLEGRDEARSATGDLDIDQDLTLQAAGAVEVGQTPPRVADLSLSHVVDDPNPVLGQDVTFTITVTNSGPDVATGVEVTDMLPSDLAFMRASVTQGSFDDLSGVWMIGALDPASSATLNLMATVEGSDPITTTAEVTASDVQDPDSTPGNGVADEDDFATLTLGTCLTAAPLRIGLNQLTYSCATPGSFVAFVRGSQRGTRTLDRYGTTVDIADAEEVALAVADSSGIAVGSLRVAQSELDQTMLVQAFQMYPGRRKSNTLSLESAPQPLASTQFLGPASSRLDVNGDRMVTALDALVIINHLQHRLHAGPDTLELDTNADSRVTAIDALLVINRLGVAQQPLVAPELSPLPNPTDRLEREVDEILLGWAPGQPAPRASHRA